MDPKDSGVEQNRGSFSGYLYKMKRDKKTIVPQWTKRWYAIEGRHLRWYRSSTSDKFSGELELASVTGVNRFEGGEKGVFSFIVACPDRNLLLRASSTSEMKMWVLALQMQVNLAKGGNGMGIVCKPTGSGSSTNLQKKLRSHTLQSELNRKMKELDNLLEQSDNGSIVCGEASDRLTSSSFVNDNHKQNGRSSYDGRASPPRGQYYEERDTAGDSRHSTSKGKEAGNSQKGSGKRSDSRGGVNAYRAQQQKAAEEEQEESEQKNWDEDADVPVRRPQARSINRTSESSTSSTPRFTEPKHVDKNSSNRGSKTAWI